MKSYTSEQLLWLQIHSQCEEWENMKAFTDAFNAQFGLNKSVGALSCAMLTRHISINSKCNNSFYTDEQKKWIIENLDALEWDSQKHFVDTFNALFGTHKTQGGMNTYLHNHGLTVKTRHNTDHWSRGMDEWLAEHYAGCGFDFVSLTREFNEAFGTDKSPGCVTKHLIRLGVHAPRRKKGQVNKGTFKKNTAHTKELPIGTIRYNSDGRPFIKVRLCQGQSAGRTCGHNYREPWWMPLQKKIWMDHYGEVPDGYVVCSLNRNPNDTDIKNIGIIDKRGTARMAKLGWWTDNRVVTGAGAEWCNLYYTARDHGVDVMISEGGR